MPWRNWERSKEKTVKGEASRGYSFIPSTEALKHYSKLSALEKLQWLKTANDFVNLVVSEEKRELWERYSKGRPT